MAAVEVVSAPAPLEVGAVPLRLEVARGGEYRHFVKGVVEEPDIGGIDDGAVPPGGVHQPHVGLDAIGLVETGTDLVFNARDAFLAHAFSEAAKGRWIHQGPEALVRDSAK